MRISPARRVAAVCLATAMAKPSPRDPDASDLRVLPMQIELGDRLLEATGEWEVVAQPYTMTGGKLVHVRVRRVDDPAVNAVRSWSVHERITVRRRAEE